VPRNPDLVGREADLALLSQVLTEGAERAVLVSGEPGVGKTALIAQLCAQAIADGWQVLRVAGVEAEEPYSLAGLGQIVFALQTFLAECDETDRAVLAPVLGGDSGVEVAVMPLVAAVLNLLAGAARTRPVMLVVDDVHWLDGVSAEVLGAVGRRLTDPRVAIVAGCRARPEMVFSVTGWGAVPLGPLGAEDSARLLERAGAPATAATTAAILAAAAGNPLALSELSRFADRIEFGSGAIPLTDRLVAVFGGRLERLSADVRDELLRAALDGITIGATSVNRPRYEMRDVEGAVDAGLLVADSTGQLVFRHPLVRSAVVYQARPQERRDAHRDLAGLYSDEPTRRAYHLAAAATEPDEEVAEALARAARLSARRGGLGVAAEWLRRASELSTRPDRRNELASEAVHVGIRGGRLNEAQAILETAGGSESALAVLAECYRVFHTDGEVISTRRRILGALATADTIDDDLTLNRLVNLLLTITNYAGDEGMREQSNAAIARLEARLAPAILLYRTGVDGIAETADSARSVLEGYVEFIPQLPPIRVVLLSFPAYCFGVMAEFRAPLQQSYKQLSEGGASIDAMESGRVVMLDLVATGHWEQARQVGTRCLEMAQQLEGSQLRRHQFLADLGLLAASQGDLATARSYAAEVTAWSAPRHLRRLVDSATRIAVRVALAQSDYEAAYRAALKLGPPGSFPPHNIEVGADMLDLVEAALLSGHTEVASMHAAEAVRQNLAEVSPRLAALTVAITAMTAPDSEAGGLYEAALNHSGGDEFPFEHARIALAQGMWLRRKLRRTDAQAPLRLAAETFDRLGARPWGDRARAELRATAASRNQTPADATTLTAQERRIAELAATGATSKQIAAQLSLSSRTVDVHLQRVFHKLAINRRGALSNALRQQESARGSMPDADRQPG
jgi:DNA-binding CsgD family transcriptional regulator/nucleoside-triphosphatase THEP1